MLVKSNVTLTLHCRNDPAGPKLLPIGLLQKHRHLSMSIPSLHPPVECVDRVELVWSNASGTMEHTGASRRNGIGAATCRALAMQGLDVLFTGWRSYDREQSQGSDEEGSPGLGEALLGLGVRARRVEIDLAHPDSPSLVMGIAQDWLGLPDVLVNNACHSTSDGFERLDAATLDAHYAVNMRATFLLAVEMARRAKTLGRFHGRVISISSGQNRGAMPGELAYAATKGAIEAFTHSLAAELAPLGEYDWVLRLGSQPENGARRAKSFA